MKYIRIAYAYYAAIVKSIIIVPLMLVYLALYGLWESVCTWRHGAAEYIKDQLQEARKAGL